MTTRDEIQMGHRVVVHSRRGARGTVTAVITDNTGAAPRRCLSIDFDGGGGGLNYPEQCGIEPGSTPYVAGSTRVRSPRRGDRLGTVVEVHEDDGCDRSHLVVEFDGVGRAIEYAQDVVRTDAEEARTDADEGAVQRVTAQYGVAVEDLAAAMWGDLVEDVGTGRVPVDVRSFADLHDHVDANEYVLGARAALGLPEGPDWDDPGEALWEDAAVTVVDRWLRDGRPAA